MVFFNLETSVQFQWKLSNLNGVLTEDERFSDYLKKGDGSRHPPFCYSLPEI